MFLAQTYRAGIYCRLSSDDGAHNATGESMDSSSIQTQKLMLENYCKEQGFQIYDTYVDDGYTGLNFDRPSFQRLLNDIDNKKINLVITKDLSRLGRDYLQTGYYTEIYFQTRKIRYIALNDNVDTDKGESDIAPFRNILNDMFSKDLSRKIKTAKRQKALQGLYLSGQTPYGYKQNPNNKNQLVIDEEAAITVRRIYQLALEGKGIAAIRKILSKEEVITPSVHKLNNGDTRFEKYINKTNWCSYSVNNILKNIVYMGDMENRKYEVENYKTKKITKVPLEKHIIVKDTHEAIITREDFQRVQELLAAKRRLSNKTHDNIFKSIVFCGVCGHRLCFASTTRKRVSGKIVEEQLYKCIHHFTNPEECPNYIFIGYDNLKNVVTERIQKYMNMVRDEKLFQSYCQKTKSNDQSVKNKEEKIKIEKRLGSLIKLTSKIYNDNIEGLIDDSTCQELLKQHQQEQKSLNIKLNEINKLLESEKDEEKNIELLRKKFNEFMGFKELTIEMVNALIKKIVIEPAKKIDGVKSQVINIQFRFAQIEL